MGFFDDATYADMDWLSQATTPLVFSGIEAANNMPQRIKITKELINEAIGSRHSNTIYKRTILKPWVDSMDWKLSDIILNFYDFECNDPCDVDPVRGTYPEICLVRNDSQFDDKIIMNYVLEKISQNLWIGCRDFGRMNEMLDLIDYKGPYRSSRSMKKKQTALQRQFMQIIKENTWKLRDADLMIKASSWLASYCLTGNLAALTNITKLKIMTHKQKPIYSIKEEK